MKNTKIYLLQYTVATTFLIFSCTKDANFPQINHEETENNLSVNELFLNDTTKIRIAELPVCFDNTEILLHINGFVNADNSKQERTGISSSTYGKKSDKYMKNFHVNSISNDILSGWFSNINFENTTNKSCRLLTDNILFINKITYLRNVSEKTNRDFLIYSVYDSDTNGDRKINTEDICSLYISALDGTGFKKISPPGHHFQKGAFVEKVMRYYFITIEDENNDGFIDNRDKHHYYYIDFSGKDYNLSEYYPLNNPCTVKDE